ncbi:Hypothetical predicted protein [Cloeon dipterum]|uniref:Chitin-binding type-4 domain-containing protein n=1 Tax=Cloeon dipterum TaxID=197152 RepID=A0A8S1CU45_9INSE|nr:Hypothetical predicted protein [Cloeon dipterum]
MVAFASRVSGHGFCKSPPSRSSMWNYGYETPISYEYNQLWCGGYQLQNEVYEGKCGPCGDSFGDARPRANENTGKYGLGIVTGTYTQGQVLTATVDITANHGGWIQFAICKLNTTNQLETEECFVPLKLKDSNETKFMLSSTDNIDTTVQLQLPPHLVCQRCVLQWHYHTASRWGICDDGSVGNGCGPQETFRTCSDISIVQMK